MPVGLAIAVFPRVHECVDVRSNEEFSMLMPTGYF